MCCDDDERLELPAAAIEMLARYRRMRDEQGFGWGEEALPEFFRWARFSRLGPVFDEFAAAGDWGAAVRAAVGAEVPAGLVLVAVTADGFGEPAARTGPPRPVPAGRTVPVEVVLDSAAEVGLVVTVQGREVPVPAGGAGLAVVDAGPEPITIGNAGSSLTVRDAVVAAPAATLRLTSPDGARWSVTDPTGGAWFPDGVPGKWDAGDRPFFHTGPGAVELTVPAGPLEVVAARGIEFERATFHVEPVAGETAGVGYRPARRFDPRAAGWFGGDLHVHLNYSGDTVLEPADAARMQAGEGLHLMQLAAGNLGGALVYDRELLESTVGTDLWSSPDAVARAGPEFRNGLLGHLHGLGLTSVPEILHTGDEGTAHPYDHPPNAAAAAALRERGGTVAYAHPVFAPGDDAGADPRALFRPFRMVEARELVADAALGLVDAVELVSCFDDRGAELLYHHLLSCGLRLAAVAGTDTFLSFARGPAPASNPPGWGRVYARPEGGTLSVDGFAGAIRAGRTLVTNGPWPELTVDGHGPGAVLDARPGDRLMVRLAVTGSGADELVLHGPDGRLAVGRGDALDHEVVVGELGLWLAGAAYGGADDPYTVGAPVYAHTSPVYVASAGRTAVRPASARWCLGLLDDLLDVAAGRGRFGDGADGERRSGELRAVVGRARAVYRALL